MRTVAEGAVAGRAGREVPRQGQATSRARPSCAPATRSSATRSRRRCSRDPGFKEPRRVQVGVRRRPAPATRLLPRRGQEVRRGAAEVFRRPGRAGRCSAAAVGSPSVLGDGPLGAVASVLSALGARPAGQRLRELRADEQTPWLPRRRTPMSPAVDGCKIRQRQSWPTSVRRRPRRWRRRRRLAGRRQPPDGPEQPVRDGDGRRGRGQRAARLTSQILARSDPQNLFGTRPGLAPAAADAAARADEPEFWSPA